MNAITKEQLLERLDNLRKQKEQLVANANACTGAIQVVESILADHYAEEAPVIVAPGPGDMQSLDRIAGPRKR